MFETTGVTSSITFSDENTTFTSTNQAYNYVNIKVIPSLSHGSKYKEFKINTLSHNTLFIGVATTTALQSTNQK